MCSSDLGTGIHSERSNHLRAHLPRAEQRSARTLNVRCAKARCQHARDRPFHPVGLGRLQLAGTVTVESVLTAVFGTVAT